MEVFSLSINKTTIFSLDCIFKTVLSEVEIFFKIFFHSFIQILWKLVKSQVADEGCIVFFKYKQNYNFLSRLHFQNCFIGSEK
jgi:hypothetical protein